MPSPREPELLVTGLGVTSSLGQGREAFIAGLLAGRDCFRVMARPGRQARIARGKDGSEETWTAFLGAELEEPSLPASVTSQRLRGASLTARVALATLAEAWSDARLDALPPERIGLLVGGSNLQQRELIEAHDRYRDEPQFLRPTYGFTFLDTDVCGLCTEVFGIRGFAYTLGGASASGQLAVIRAMSAVASGEVDACIALGALTDLSYWECQGLRSMGAMGSDRYADAPARACRPFDRSRDGFIFGESCGAVVVERRRPAPRTGVEPYARLSGWALGSDGNRYPDPSLAGEVAVIKKALWRGNLTSSDIDYVNPHGSGSLVGDTTELAALERCGLKGAWINATKSITGHGLSAAGTVELIAVLLQMKAGRLHPTRNLEEPLDREYNWVAASPVDHAIRNALTLSFGFGGINSAIAVQHC